MRIRSLTIDRRFLDSRVARRMFLVVATCALLPVAAFALFSYRQVRDQLEGDATHLLQRESKAAGMAIIERLLLAEDALHLSALAQSAAVEVPRLEGPTARVFQSLRSVPAGAPYLAGLSLRERAHLARGKTLLMLERKEAGNPEILLLRMRTPKDPGEGAWAAVLKPDYIFTAERRAGTDRYWVVDHEGSPLFWTPLDAPPRRIRLPNDPKQSMVAEKVQLDGETWLATSWHVFLGGAFGSNSWNVGLARPLAEVHRPLHEFDKLFPWVAAIALCCALGLTLFQVRRSLIPIAALAKGAQRIAEGDLAARVMVESRDEFGDLALAFNEMGEVISRQVGVLSTINAIGASLSAEFDAAQLLELILMGTMEVTRADGGALFLLRDDGLADLSQARFGASASVPVRSLEAALPRAAINRCMSHGDAVRVDDLSQAESGESESWAALGGLLGRPVHAYIAVPLRPERDEILGVLLLMRYRDECFEDEECSLAVSLTSQAAVSLRKNRLVDSFRALFEGVIQLTAKAIDEKSPYTGDHCRKVPIITELIADAACATTDGPLKDFTMTPEERYELRIAALLHDCGKMVTPVHVMDKATKLETIFDRIELVETRFEVLRRDAALRAFARRLGRAEAAALVATDSEHARELDEIEADLDFLRSSNVGGESMPESDQERVREIADRHSWSPAGRSERSVLEPEDAENLTISSGTLNEAEREIINQHVVTTISLLEELPFPDDMRNVPAIAGAHHEHADGTGYPLRLRGDQLSIQARILCLADVFEALTAKDRPYKPGRTLSETLEIIDGMCREGHIHRDLFELLVRDKLHLRYAARYLSPEQIDPVHSEALAELTDPWSRS